MAASISDLRKKRGIAKGCITILTSNLADFVQTADVATLKARILSLNKYLATYETVSNDIYDLVDDESELADLAGKDADYTDGIRVIIIKLESLVASGTTASPSTVSPVIKLPTLQLPTFAGNAKDWLSFWDLFKCAVHSNVTNRHSEVFVFKGSVRGRSC